MKLPKFRAPSAFAVAAIVSAGCASAPPSDIRDRPVVVFGTAASSPDAILKLEAGKPIPATADIRGSLLAQPAHADMTVALARDVYLYKRWASFDRVLWQPADKLIGSSVRIETPSAASPKAGSIVLEFDDRTLAGTPSAAAAH